MKDKRPSYARPTCASLARDQTRTNTEPSSEGIAHEHTVVLKGQIHARKLEYQNQLARLQLEAAENRRRLLHPSLKWPTKETIQAYRRNPNNKHPVRDSVREPFHDSPFTSRGYRDMRQQYPVVRGKPKYPDSDFPFRVHNAKDTPTFPKFPELPTELRLKIWEQAVLAPKFIEVSELETGMIVGPMRYEVLTTVCWESRLVAQRLRLHASTIKHMSNSKTAAMYDRSQASFRPAVDTVFLRPMPGTNGACAPVYLFHWHPNLAAIRHLAFPFDVEGSNDSTWASCIALITKLETLTLVLGANAQSWARDRSLQLRNFEEWFVDGRNRIARFGDKDWAEIEEVPELVPSSNPNLKVRLVGWKKLRNRP